MLVNGYPLKREELKGEFEETVVSTILRQTGELQKAVYNVSIFRIWCFLIVTLLLCISDGHAMLCLPRNNWLN